MVQSKDVVDLGLPCYRYCTCHFVRSLFSIKTMRMNLRPVTDTCIVNLLV
jgi:hypothetical protein